MATVNDTLRTLVAEMGGTVVAELPGRVGFRLEGLPYVLHARGNAVLLTGKDKGAQRTVEVASLEALNAAVAWS
jgi:hypothetical protein